MLLLALWSPVAGVADAGHPLEPLDLSSPRATLNSFLTTGDAFFHLLRDDYWHTPSRAVVDRIGDFNTKLERCPGPAKVCSYACTAIDWTMPVLVGIFAASSRYKMST